MTPTLTGNWMADVAIGAIAGFLGAPKKKDALIYALAGAVATGVAGSVGLIGLIGVALYQSQLKGQLRPELRSAG